MVEDYAIDGLAVLAERMKTCNALWVLGGSTGLSIRGAALARSPRDIDIYADAADARLIHAHLQGWATDRQQVSTTDRYRSILSHYAVNGAVVELVGDFRIDAAGSHYVTEVTQILHPASDGYPADEFPVRLIPLGHELIFNLLRDRRDRCEQIGAMIRSEPDKHEPLLQTLIKRNNLSADVRQLVRHYAGMSEKDDE